MKPSSSSPPYSHSMKTDCYWQRNSVTSPVGQCIFLLAKKKEENQSRLGWYLNAAAGVWSSPTVQTVATFTCTKFLPSG